MKKFRLERRGEGRLSAARPRHVLGQSKRFDRSASGGKKKKKKSSEEGEKGGRGGNRVVWRWRTKRNYENGAKKKRSESSPNWIKQKYGLVCAELAEICFQQKLLL